MPNRVELPRPFAVVERGGQGNIVKYLFLDASTAHETAVEYDRDWPQDAPHIVVRLTALVFAIWNDYARRDGD